MIILSDEAFKHAYDEEFWGYVGTSSQLLCLKFYTFVQYHIFVYFLFSNVRR